jgi:hypothetical protein
MIKYKEFLGYNVAAQLIDLADEIKKKNPLLQFSIGSNRTSFFSDDRDASGNPVRVEVKTSLYVHDVNDMQKPIGSIGYDTDEKYWVRSRLIANEKYGHWNRSQYESKFSKHMKNIVKEAGKSLKPFSYEEMVAEHEGGFARVLSARSNQAVAKANSYVKMDFPVVFQEMLHMHNIGYIPATPKFAQAIQYVVDNKEELEKYYNYAPKKCMIWVRPNNVVYEIDKEIKQVNTTADLPEDLRGKLFVLDVTDKGQFVEDVGIKQDTGIYWVLL